MQKLTNYPNSKCRWGYSSLCLDCVAKYKTRIRYIDFEHPIDPAVSYYPGNSCEECGRRGEVVVNNTSTQGDL
jgi:hypothetical protein